MELVAEAERAGPCRRELAPISKSEPMLMAIGLLELSEQAAERHAPGLHLRMPSGAGHDAQILSRATGTGWRIVRSLKGISHHWAEDTTEAVNPGRLHVFGEAAEGGPAAG